jgi:hypothetical protein
MENTQLNLQLCLEKIMGKKLSYIDLAFMDDVSNLMVKLDLEPSTIIKEMLEKYKNAKFPLYLLFLELNEKLFNNVIKNSKWPFDIALTQLFIFDPLSFSDKYRSVENETIKDFCLSLLSTPKDIFWNWSEKYDPTVRDVFEIVCLHPEGLTLEDIYGKLDGKLESWNKIKETLSDNSILLKYFFIIKQGKKYYPFFSNNVIPDTLVKVREHLKMIALQKAELLKIGYDMPKYHIDVMVKLLKGAKNLTSVLKAFANKSMRFDDVKILKVLLKTRRMGLSKYMISRMKERFEALESDGLIRLIEDNYFLTDLAKDLIFNNRNIVLSLSFSEILLFEEKIVKKGHEYWDIREYLNQMLRLGLIKKVIQCPDRLFLITPKGKDVLRRGFDPRILLER